MKLGRIAVIGLDVSSNRGPRTRCYKTTVLYINNIQRSSKFYNV